MKHSFLGYLSERSQIDEAFNSNPYEITMGKKSAGDVFFTFLDEDEKEFRIQFYTPQGIGKNVRQVFIGQRRGNTYPDAIAKFRTPMRVIATMIEATKQFLLTPIGKGIDGFAINFSKKALDRGVTLLPKIIRQSGLKQKLNVMDLNFSPDPARGYVWVIRKGLAPEAVFNGPKLKGITWDDPDKVGDKPSQQDVRDAALQGDIDDQSDFVNKSQSETLWSYSLTGNPGSERFPMLTYEGADTYSVIGSPKTGKITVNRIATGAKISGTSLMAVLRRVGASNPSAQMIDQFNKDMLNPENKGVPSNPAPDLSKNWRYNDNKHFGTPPNLSYYQRNGNSYVTGELYPSAKTSSVIVGLSNKKGKVEDIFVDNVLNKLGLPSIPDAIVKQFVADSLEWQKANINDAQDIVGKLKMPKLASVLTTSASGFTLIWDLKFQGGDLDGAYIVTHYWIYPGEGYAEAQKQVLNKKGKQIAASPKYKVVNSVVGIQDAIDSEASYYDIVKSQLQNLYSVSYNPGSLYLDAISFNKMGQVLFRGEDMGYIRNRQSVLDALSSAARDAEAKTSSGKLSPEDMVAVLQKMQTNTRNVDWQIRSWQGKVYVDWDITFRRTTRVGAFNEFQSEINSANNASNSMAAQLNKNGYKAVAVLMTKEIAQRQDDSAIENEGTAYSEYEQSIGGGVTVS